MMPTGFALVMIVVAFALGYFLGKGEPEDDS